MPQRFRHSVSGTLAACSAPRVHSCPALVSVLVIAGLTSPVLAQPVISIGDMSVVEGDSSVENVVLRFPLTLSEMSPNDVSVLYTTAAGTAASGSDYIHVGGALVTIPAGERNGFADVSIVEDLDVEPDETFSVTLSSPTNTLIGNETATGTILNDEDNITLSIGDAEEVEGDFASDNVVLQFLLSLSAPPTKPVTVRYTTVSGSAAAFVDYVHVSNALVTFEAGETERLANVFVVEDLDVEPDETFSVTLSSPTNTLIGNETATGTILNDEDNITLSIGDAEEVEGDFASDNVVLQFPLSLSAPPTKPVTVRYTTVSGSAAAFVDYVHVSNALVTFEAGETERLANVFVIEDLNVEPDETFSVILSSPTNTLIGNETATGTILNDDGSVDVPPGVDPVPSVLAFAGVTPNPLVSGGTVGFSLPVEAGVRLDVYDVRGRRVARLVDARFAPGAHSVPWPAARGDRLASGVYIVRFEALDRVFTSRAVVIR